MGESSAPGPGASPSQGQMCRAGLTNEPPRSRQLPPQQNVLRAPAAPARDTMCSLLQGLFFLASLLLHTKESSQALSLNRAFVRFTKSPPFTPQCYPHRSPVPFPRSPPTLTGVPHSSVSPISWPGYGLPLAVLFLFSFLLLAPSCSKLSPLSLSPLSVPPPPCPSLSFSSRPLSHAWAVTSNRD